MNFEPVKERGAEARALLLALQARKRGDTNAPTGHDIVRLVMATGGKTSMLEEQGKLVYNSLLGLSLFRECMLFLSKCADVEEIHCKHLIDQCKGDPHELALALVFAMGCGLGVTREQGEYLCIVEKVMQQQQQQPKESKAGNKSIVKKKVSDESASSSSSSSSKVLGAAKKKSETEKGNKGKEEKSGSPKSVSKVSSAAIGKFFTETFVEDKDAPPMPMSMICKLYKTWAQNVDKTAYAAENGGLRVPDGVSDRTMRVTLSLLPLTWDMHGTEARRRFHLRLKSEAGQVVPKKRKNGKGPEKSSPAKGRAPVVAEKKKTPSRKRKAEVVDISSSSSASSTSDDEESSGSSSSSGSVSLGSEDEEMPLEGNNEEDESSEEASWIVTTKPSKKKARKNEEETSVQSKDDAEGSEQDEEEFSGGGEDEDEESSAVSTCNSDEDESGSAGTGKQSSDSSNASDGSSSSSSSSSSSDSSDSSESESDSSSSASTKASGNGESGKIEQPKEETKEQSTLVEVPRDE